MAVNGEINERITPQERFVLRPTRKLERTGGFRYIARLPCLSDFFPRFRNELQGCSSMPCSLMVGAGQPGWDECAIEHLHDEPLEGEVQAVELALSSSPAEWRQEMWMHPAAAERRLRVREENVLEVYTPP